MFSCRLRQAQPSSHKENPLHTLAVIFQHTEEPKPSMTSPNSHSVDVIGEMPMFGGGYRPLMAASSHLDQHKGETHATQANE